VTENDFVPGLDFDNRYFKSLQKTLYFICRSTVEDTSSDAEKLSEALKNAWEKYAKNDSSKQMIVYVVTLALGRPFLIRHVRFLANDRKAQKAYIDGLIAPVAEFIVDALDDSNKTPVDLYPLDQHVSKSSPELTAKRIAFIRKNIGVTDKLYQSSPDVKENGGLLVTMCFSVKSLLEIEAEESGIETFPIPSNYDIWNPLLFLFTAGKSPLYFRAFQKEPADRSVEEQAEIDALIDSVFAIDTDYGGNQAVSQISFDDPRGLCELLAVPQKGATLFLNDKRFTRETLYIQVQKELMSESGLRHFLALLLSFYRNQGRFTWRVNDHLKMLGCQKKNNGDYSPRDVESAKNTINMFTKILFTVPDRLHPEKSKTFPLAVIEEIDHATDWSQIDGVSLIAPKWYQEAMNGSGSKGAQYTLLLEKLLREKNTTNRPNAAVVLSVRFSLLWRIHGKELRMKLSTLLNFFEPASKRTRPKKQLLNLQTTLNYLVERAYMGSWVLDSGLSLEDVTDPDKEYVTLYPPEWLNKNISTLQASREAVKAVKKPIPPASKDRVKNIIDQLLQKGYTQHNIAQSIGVSQTSINLWKKGARKISPENYIKLLDLLENQA